MTYSVLNQTLATLLSLGSLGIAAAAPALATAAPGIAEPTQAAAHLLLTQGGDTIVDVAAGNDDFSTLVAAVQAADLVDALSSEGPLTVFAPTNEAFAALPDGVLETLLMPENQDLLIDLLSYHVVPGEVTADDLRTPGSLDTLNGPVDVDSNREGVFINDASVVIPDVEASNGVIHAIDTVLVPEGFVDELQARMMESETEETVVEEVVEEPTTTGGTTTTTTTTSPAPTMTTTTPAPTTSEPVQGLW
jgi:uncharacterized surface protein with fasciclin (FAS1) repeats